MVWQNVQLAEMLQKHARAVEHWGEKQEQGDSLEKMDREGRKDMRFLEGH